MAKEIVKQARAQAKEIVKEARGEASKIRKALDVEVRKAANEIVKRRQQALDAREKTLKSREDAINKSFFNQTGRNAEKSVVLILDSMDYKRLRSDLHPDRVLDDDVREKVTRALALINDSTLH